MLKIYRVFEEKDQIKIQDYLKFKDGRFNAGLHGFGEIKSGNDDCTKANYELQTLKSYKKYLQSIKNRWLCTKFFNTQSIQLSNVRKSI